jgi:hypothetical protein
VDFELLNNFFLLVWVEHRLSISGAAI